MARVKFVTRFHEATSRYGSHMGTCYHYPAWAEAWARVNGVVTAEVQISSEQYPNLEPAQMEEKALAILRAQIRA